MKRQTAGTARPSSAASDVILSADGTISTGRVPALVEGGPNNVTLHAGDPDVNLPPFGALAFTLT